MDLEISALLGVGVCSDLGRAVCFTAGILSDPGDCRKDGGREGTVAMPPVIHAGGSMFIDVHPMNPTLHYVVPGNAQHPST